jgi:urea transport system permease protein
MAIGVLIVAAAPLKAGPYEDALVKFTADSYSDTDAAIGGVAASGNPLAEEVIRALQESTKQLAMVW